MEVTFRALTSKDAKVIVTMEWDLYSWQCALGQLNEGKANAYEAACVLTAIKNAVSQMGRTYNVDIKETI